MRRMFPILVRFAGAPEFCHEVRLCTAPTGIAQVNVGMATASPLNPGAVQSPAAFARDAGLLPGTLPTHGEYIPAFAPDAKIGHLAIGRSGINHKRPYHRQIDVTPSGLGELDVEEKEYP